MTFSLKNTKLLDSDPSSYTFTEKQHEIDESPPESENYEFKDDLEDTPPKEFETNIQGGEDIEESEYKPF